MNQLTKNMYKYAMKMIMFVPKEVKKEVSFIILKSLVMNI